MHFFQAIVSFMLIIGCMALAFPSYDMNADPLHRRAEPNPPAKLAQRAEVAPRTDLAPRPVLPPRSDVAPRGSEVAPQADLGPLNGLVDRAHLDPRATVTIKIWGKIVIRTKNETIEAEGEITVSVDIPVVEIWNAGKLLWREIRGP